MGLDRDDIIIRRRLAQKLTFLTEDLAAGTVPSPEALQNFFAANAERYTVPERVSFRHRYFSTDRRTDAYADAVAAIAAASRTVSTPPNIRGGRGRQIGSGAPT